MTEPTKGDDTGKVDYTIHQLGQDVTDVIGHFWDDEREDYYENCSDDPQDNQRAGHIFETLRRLAAWAGLQMTGEGDDDGEDEATGGGSPDV